MLTTCDLAFGGSTLTIFGAATNFSAWEAMLANLAIDRGQIHGAVVDGSLTIDDALSKAAASIVLGTRVQVILTVRADAVAPHRPSAAIALLRERHQQDGR